MSSLRAAVPADGRALVDLVLAPEAHRGRPADRIAPWRDDPYLPTGAYWRL